MFSTSNHLLSGVIFLNRPFQIKKSGSRIFGFDLKSVLNASHQSKVKPSWVSASAYSCMYENSFQVFRDERTLNRVSASNKRVIQIEDVTKQNSQTLFEQQSSEVHCLVLSEQQDTILAGDCSSSVTQYKRNELTNTWEQEHQYRDLQVGDIQAMASFGKSVFVGGDEGRICVLDFEEKTIKRAFFETAITLIYSLQICRVSLGQVFLAVSGTYANYDDELTDLFEVVRDLTTSSGVFVGETPNQESHKVDRSQQSSEKQKTRVVQTKVLSSGSDSESDQILPEVASPQAHLKQDADIESLQKQILRLQSKNERLLFEKDAKDEEFRIVKQNYLNELSRQDHRIHRLQDKQALLSVFKAKYGDLKSKHLLLIRANDDLQSQLCESRRQNEEIARFSRQLQTESRSVETTISQLKEKSETLIQNTLQLEQENNSLRVIVTDKQQEVDRFADLLAESTKEKERMQRNFKNRLESIKVHKPSLILFTRQRPTAFESS